jgi:signal recognition particle receptor subunit beta
MVLINYATKEIVAKVVYYGPGLCGKTTNLQYIYTRLNPKKRGKLISLATEADRTLFFDFLPVELGLVQGFSTLNCTVPGQVFYAPPKIVLKGADALVFVADSQADVMNKNIESVEDMKQNLLDNDLDPSAIPIVFQYNKRDLDNTVEVWLLEEKLNYRQAPSYEAVAVGGTGVMETFMGITNLLIKDLKRKHSMMDTYSGNSRLNFAQMIEKPAEPEEEIPIESVLELGSGYRYGEENDVLPGELLDQMENISLVDSVQAEAFFDNVRKGAPTEEASRLKT